MNKRIVYLSQLYEKIGNYLQAAGDANIVSISTHCNHPEQIYYTLKLETLNDALNKNINGYITIRYVDVPVDDPETKDTLDILCRKYIEDTACDGQLFCGCRQEDCVMFKTEDCIKCLKNHLHKECIEEGIKTMLKSKIERD